MSIVSGEYPYNYTFPFPFRIPSPSGNVSGLLNLVDPNNNRLPFVSTLPILSGVHIGQAWHVLVDQLRRYRRFREQLTIKAYINPEAGVFRSIREPDVSGIAWTSRGDTPEFPFSQAGPDVGRRVAISGQSQVTVPEHVEDLRIAFNVLANAITDEYNNPSVDFLVDTKTGQLIPWDKDFIIGDYLRSTFGDTPSGAVGDYNYPIEQLSSGAFFDITWGEVFYNPYPRVMGTPTINLTNNIQDLRFESAATIKERGRIYARLSHFGPVFPACQTPGGEVLVPSQRDKDNIRFDTAFVTGLSGYIHQKESNTVRIDGHVLVPGLVELRVIDNINRDPNNGIGTNGFTHIEDRNYEILGRSNSILQSGTREFGRTIDRKPATAGMNIVRFPATTIGFPSASGEPVGLIAGSQPVVGDIIEGDHSTRAWFDMPILGNHVNDTPFSIVTPRFGEVQNVKRIAVVATGSGVGTVDSSGILRAGIAPSGLLSIWPSPGAYMAGSGQGYHIMDKGIWMRHNQQSQGMTLFSPYNGERLLFRFADTSNYTIEEAIRKFGNTVSYDITNRLINTNGFFATHTYGVSWGGTTGKFIASAWGPHSDGFYHVFGTRTADPANAANQVPIDDATNVGGDNVPNGTVNLVSDFTTGVSDPYPGGFCSVTKLNEKKAHALFNIPELSLAALGKATLGGNTVNLVDNPSASLNPRSLNGTFFFIVAAIGGGSPSPIPVGFTTPSYFTVFTWNPGRGLTERTSSGPMVGLGSIAASVGGILNGGGWPAITREDLWNLANSIGSDGTPAFGTGTTIRTGTHPIQVAVFFGSPVDNPVQYEGVDTNVVTFTAGTGSPSCSIQGITSPTPPGVVQDNLVLRTQAGTIGSQVVAAITSNFNGQHLGNKAIGGSERQITGLTYVDNEVIVAVRGNNRFSDFADNLSLAPFDTGLLNLDEKRLNSQDLDPGVDFNYIGEIEPIIDEPFWPQIVFADIN